MNYIDVFAGAGGLSEGFMCSGFHPLAHIEMNKDAIATIKTRLAYHYLKRNGRIDEYNNYLKGAIKRDALYNKIPSRILDSAIRFEMSENNMSELFSFIDRSIKNKSVDIIIGGPPCQAYSLAGRHKQKKITPSSVDDDRKYLYKLYSQFLSKYHPKLFVFENVIGLLSSDNGKHWNDIKILFDKVGYSIDYRSLNSKDFGVPQQRKRIIIIGWRKGSEYKFPEFPRVKPNWTLEDILRDLPSLQPGEMSNDYSINKPHKYVTKCLRNKDDLLTQHAARPVNERDRTIYNIAIRKWDQSKRLNYADLPSELKTHKNEKVFTDRFKVIPSTQPYCHTMLAHISKDGHYYIHYDINQIRSITIREAARIQSFPDNYYFEGSRTSAYSQIGNAVPPLMAEGIAKALKKQLLVEGKKKDV